MNVPRHMHITASLMVGYTMPDGSLIEVDRRGDYRITNATGEVIAETADSEPGLGKGLHRYGGGPRIAEDYGDILEDLAVFLMADADRYDESRNGEEIQRHDEFGFNEETAAWANANYDELSILACYGEDKRLGEGVFAEEEV